MTTPDTAPSLERCLSVVVPCFNEAATVVTLLERVLAQRSVGEVIVVDDASTDESVDRVLRVDDSRVRLLRQAFNMGKGAAIARGIAAATMPFLVIQDADLEYDPNEYERLLEPLLDGRADVSFGSRFQGTGSRRVLYYWHTVGNRILTTASNAMTNLNLTDMETCYKMGRTEVMQAVDLEEDRFGVEPEITAKLAAAGVVIYETGISYDGRTYAEGKKINWKDGVSAFRCIAKYRRRSRVRFPDPAEVDATPMPPELVASLDTLDGADNYNGMIAGLIVPWLGANNLEIGAGIGTISTAVLGHRTLDEQAHLHLTDPDGDNVNRLKERFGEDRRVSISQVDAFAALQSGPAPDAVWMANVLEHIDDDAAIIDACASALVPGGHLILFVPAGRGLYSETDQAMGHYRRYTMSSLNRVLAANGMRPVAQRYVNAPGALAWWALTRRLKRQPVDGPLVRAYDRMVPTIAKVEAAVHPPFGQSIFCVAEAV